MMQEYPQAFAYHEQYKASLQEQRASIDAYLDVRDGGFWAIVHMEDVVRELMRYPEACDPASDGFKNAQEAVAHARFRLEAMQGAYIPSDLHRLKHAWLRLVWRADESLTRCREVASLKQQYRTVEKEDLAQKERDVSQWSISLQDQVVQLLDRHHAPRLARRALASFQVFAEAHPHAVADAAVLSTLHDRVEAAVAQGTTHAEQRSAAAWDAADSHGLDNDVNDFACGCISWSMQLLDARDDVAHEESFLAFVAQCLPQGPPFQLRGKHLRVLSSLPVPMMNMEEDPSIEISANLGSPWAYGHVPQQEVDAFEEGEYCPAYQSDNQPQHSQLESQEDRRKRVEAAQKEAQKQEERRCEAIVQAHKGAQHEAIKNWQKTCDNLKRSDAQQREAGIKAIKKLRQETARALEKTAKADKKAYERANRALDDAWKVHKKNAEKAMARLEKEIKQGHTAMHWRHNNVRQSMQTDLTQARARYGNINAQYDRAAQEVNVQRARVAQQVRRAPLPHAVRHTGFPLGSRPTEREGFTPIQTPLGEPFCTPAGTPAWADLVATTDQYAEAQARIEHLDQKPLRQNMVDYSALMIHRADNYFSASNASDGHEMLGQVRLVLDVAVDIGLGVMFPQVAMAKSVMQIITSTNMMTGQPLSDWDMGMEAVNVICLGHLKHVTQASTWLAEVAGKGGATARAADSVIGHWKVADQAARLAVKSHVKPELAGEAIYRSIIDGTYVGAAYSSAVLQTVGELNAAERAIAREFGGLQGVLAWRDPRVQEIASGWGTSWDGHNQLAVHLFRSHDYLFNERLSRLTSTETMAGIENDSLSRVLEKSDAASIIDSYITFDKAAKHVKRNALENDYFARKGKEVWWIKHASKGDLPKSKGLTVIALDGKFLSIMSNSKDRLPIFVKKYLEKD
jgi:hypothetical protein